MDKEISSALLRILPFIVVIAIIAVRLSVKHLSPQDIALQTGFNQTFFMLDTWFFGVCVTDRMYIKSFRHPGN